MHFAIRCKHAFHWLLLLSSFPFRTMLMAASVSPFVPAILPGDNTCRHNPAIRLEFVQTIAAHPIPFFLYEFQCKRMSQKIILRRSFQKFLYPFYPVHGIKVRHNSKI